MQNIAKVWFVHFISSLLKSFDSFMQDLAFFKTLMIKALQYLWTNSSILNKSVDL